MGGTAWDSKKEGIRTWEGAYRYVFGEGANIDDKWHLVDLPSWRILGTDGKEVPEHRDLLAGNFGNILAAFGRQGRESDVLNWFAQGKKAAPVGPAAPGPLSVLFSNVLTAERLSAFSVLTSRVEGHATFQLSGLPPGQPAWYYQAFDDEYELLDEYCLVFPEMFFYWDTRSKAWVLKSANLIADLRTFLLYNRILHECSVLEYRFDTDAVSGLSSVRVRVRVKTTAVPYEKASVCRCIPIPGKLKESKASPPLGVQTPEVVVASPVVGETLQLLSEVWQDRLAKSILLSAPPGSGKEDYARSIPYGNGRIAGTDDLPTLCLAAGTKETLEPQLFGVADGEGGVMEGLVARSADKSLFLDEVHYPDDEPGIRASLLRTFESDDYTPVGATQPQKVKNVLFILATSRRLRTDGEGSSGKPLSEIPPVDFWTRMTHVLEVKHLLDYDETSVDRDRKHHVVLQALFKAIWWRKAEEYYGVSKQGGDKDVTAGQALCRDRLRSVLAGATLTKLSKLFACCLSQSVKEAGAHAEAGVQLRDVSVRGIRTMVTRLFSHVAARVARGEDIYDKRDFVPTLRTVVPEILAVALLARGQAGDESENEWVVTVKRAPTE